MRQEVLYTEDFLDSFKALTGIPKGKLREYAKQDNLFNIIDTPRVINPTKDQMKRIDTLKSFISSYSILRMEEENKRIKINSCDRAGQYFRSMLREKRDREVFMVAYLDTKHYIIETKVISEGSIDQAMVEPRRILRHALDNEAAAIICCHNHPSQDPQPSGSDRKLTQRLVNVFEPLEIKCLDHIIVGGSRFKSFLNEGIMPKYEEGMSSYEAIPLNRKSHLEECKKSMRTRRNFAQNNISR